MKKLLLIGLASILTFLAGCSAIREPVVRSWKKTGGKVAILIDLPDQHAYLSKGRSSRVDRARFDRSRGIRYSRWEFNVIEKDIDHRSSIYGAYVRDGMIVQENVDVRKDPRPPDSTFVGASMPYFLRIVGGVGLHAGYLPGYPASHGCIRMPESKAKRFFEAAKVGTPVTIKR